MVQSIRGSGTLRASGTALGSKFGLMVPSTKEIGCKTWQRVRAAFYMLMARSMKATGSRTRHTARAYSLTLTDPDTKVSGVKTCNMALVLRPGLTGHFSREITNKVSKMAQGVTHGQMEAHSRETIPRTKWRDM